MLLIYCLPLHPPAPHSLSPHPSLPSPVSVLPSTPVYHSSLRTMSYGYTNRRALRQGGPKTNGIFVLLFIIYTVAPTAVHLQARRTKKKKNGIALSLPSLLPSLCRSIPPFIPPFLSLSLYPHTHRLPAPVALSLSVSGCLSPVHAQIHTRTLRW